MTFCGYIFAYGVKASIGPLRPPPTLVHELTTFQTKDTLAGNETFGAWREGAHDDLVLAVALAAWFGEHEPHPYAGALAWVPEEDEEERGEPRSRLQVILDELGLRLDGDW